MKQAGFGKEVGMVEAGLCPDCGEEIEPDSFRNPISIKEFNISGMCQECQDNFFGKD